jgi:L-seryl-tRNA(Ser) seleniumtransferase
MKIFMVELKDVPSTDSFLQDPYIQNLIAHAGRSLTLEAIRTEQSVIREGIIHNNYIPERSESHKRITAFIEHILNPSLKPVINASGVILHTNLGRAPLSNEALQSLNQVASGYSTLEYDLERGKRGSRLIHAEKLFQQYTGAESAVVVNNNAGAVLLCLAALANRKKVAVSRSQLIEIGGGFRIPDVMRQSGAKLIEVGTTNRTHLSDYETALHDGCKLIMVAHHSNFRIVGFTKQPPIPELVALAKSYKVPILNDLGSGALVNTEDYGLPHEYTVQDSIQDGCDIVTFSGDKLLGGPQAGIIIGKKDHLDKIKKHPLARALRADKLCLTALSTTITHYIKGEINQKIPVYQMLSRELGSLQSQANGWKKILGHGEVIMGKSTTGGGSLPEESLDTWLLAFKDVKAQRFLSLLRQQKPPIIARIEADMVVIDPRTVLPFQEENLLSGIKNALLQELG